MEDEVATRIREYVSSLLPRVSDAERSWLQAHVIDPRPVELANDVEGLAKIRVWLVTDHTDDSDASYRIIYNPNEDSFGYECTLEDGRSLFLGHVGTLKDALEGL